MLLQWYPSWRCQRKLGSEVYFTPPYKDHPPPSPISSSHSGPYFAATIPGLRPSGISFSTRLMRWMKAFTTYPCVLQLITLFLGLVHRRRIVLGWRVDRHQLKRCLTRVVELVLRTRRNHNNIVGGDLLLAACYIGLAFAGSEDEYLVYRVYLVLVMMLSTCSHSRDC